MFSDLKIPVQSLLTAGPLVNLLPSVRVDELQKIGRKYDICYETISEWSILEGRKVQTAFQVELCGFSNHADGARHPVPGCTHCRQTYEEMCQVAEWILPTAGLPSNYDIRPFDRALHIAPAARKHRREVVVNIVVKYPGNLNRLTVDCKVGGLEAIRERLSELGIKEASWCSEAETHTH